MPTEYPFMLNIQNPTIAKAYAAYHRHNNLPSHFPLSDNERLDFEVLFMCMFSQKHFEKWLEEYCKIVTNPLAAAKQPERSTPYDHCQTPPDKPPAPAHP